MTRDHRFPHRQLAFAAEGNRPTFDGAHKLELGCDELFLDPGEVEFDLLAGPRQAFGLLVVDGLIAVQLDAGRAHITWLIGPEDLIRPWEMEDAPLTSGSRWRALRQTRLRIVKGAFYRRAQRDPGVIQALLVSATRTTHWLLAKSMILSTPTIEDRLLLLFALWGERWGKMTPDGVCIELPLTHDLLASCCGARRPTVTVALHSLEEKGFLSRPSRSEWVLARKPHADGSCQCWERYSQALGLNQTNGNAKTHTG